MIVVIEASFNDYGFTMVNPSVTSRRDLISFLDRWSSMVQGSVLRLL